MTVHGWSFQLVSWLVRTNSHLLTPFFATLHRSLRRNCPPKDLLVSVLPAVMLTIFYSSFGLAQATPQKCDHCGKLATNYVVCCQLTSEVKKEKRTVWSTREEYFCAEVPNFSLTQLLRSIAGAGRNSEFQNPPCDGMAAVPQQPTPQGCSFPRTRKILLREEKEEETALWKCKPVILCPPCAQAASLPAEDGQKKASPDRSI